MVNSDNDDDDDQWWQSDPLWLESTTWTEEQLTWLREDEGRRPLRELIAAFEENFVAAKGSGWGVDPYLARMLIQELINVGSFPASNPPIPEAPDPGDWRAQSLFDVARKTSIFSFERKQPGRPENLPAANRVAYMVGAVEGRLGLSRTRNDEINPDSQRSRGFSAGDVVAAAHARLGMKPATYASVRSALRGDRSDLAIADGRVFGERSAVDQPPQHAEGRTRKK